MQQQTRRLQTFRHVSVALALLAMCLSVVVVTPVAAETLGYPDSGVPCSHSPYATTGTCANYDWGPVRDNQQGYSVNTTYSSRGYGYRNCTDYVAWKLQSLGVADAKTHGLGHGGQWADNAPSHGLTVLTSPKAGTAAVVPGNPGHVAYVESVNTTNGTITVSEYNAGKDGTGRTWTGAPSSRGFAKFVDFGVNVGGSSGVVPPVAWGGVGLNTYVGSDRLTAGQQLNAGQYLLSPDGRAVLIMQVDGNLVMYGGGNLLWASGTVGNPGAYLKMQADGNVVIWTQAGAPIWNTGPRAIDRLVVQPDGNLVAYNGTYPAWAAFVIAPLGGQLTNFGSDRLTVGQNLTTNKFLRSADGRYFLVMQSDGNLVLYSPGYHVLWYTQTGGNPGSRLTVQADGNVVIWNASNAPIWNTGPRAVDRFVMQSDGNGVAYNGSFPAWATGTDGRI